MNRHHRYPILVALSLGFLGSSCEDVIDVDLNSANPQLIITADVNNVDDSQLVTISRTVPFSADQPFEGVSGAAVGVYEEVNGELSGAHQFLEEEPGRYVATNFKGIEGATYTLYVQVNDTLFTATVTMPNSVVVDSIGTSVRNVFDEEQKLITLKFQDPPGMPNYYRYLWSINGRAFDMLHVSRDKFNDGKYVSEDLFDFDVELTEGDAVTVRMQCINQATYDFWNAVQSTNPGTAAPANPPSVFGKAALGYFSAHAMEEFSVEVQ
ncbi:DUF4249 domain-containing protein [Parapedobacter sp. DT-150]|uniref:DUF4249 domain-containing protein n=1 Tax=Parapedobacter sp. DT-150 TaxID=3396162 RepID=UPI003F1CA0E9